MNKAALLANMLAQMGEEGDDIVFDLGLDLIDPLDAECDVFGFPDRLDRRLRDNAQLGKLFGGVGLDQIPDLILVLVRPDGGHLRSGITRDHGSAPGTCYRRGACAVFAGVWSRGRGAWLVCGVGRFTYFVRPPDLFRDLACVG